MKHECEIWSCENMEYLGHFNNPDFLRAGHNSSGEEWDTITGDYMTGSTGDISTYVPNSEGNGIVKDPNKYETLPDDPSRLNLRHTGTTAQREQAKDRDAAFAQEYQATVQNRALGKGRDAPLSDAMRGTRSSDYGKDI